VESEKPLAKQLAVTKQVHRPALLTSPQKQVSVLFQHERARSSAKTLHSQLPNLFLLAQMLTDGRHRPQPKKLIFKIWTARFCNRYRFL